MKKAGRMFLQAGAVILFLSGAVLCGSPFYQEWQSEKHNQKQIAAFEEQRKVPKETLREEMRAYNERIFGDHQKNLKDAWSYEQEIFQLKEYDQTDSMIGFLKIHAMNLELPLYLGANSENMEQGAAVLGQTSMPIGGENTNCVIAGHRGWKGIPMFRDIELLQPGDEVIVENFWETLRYQVSEIRIILPDDIEAVKIQEGEDMLTLMTCHPYTDNTHRYVVYCKRVTEQTIQECTEKTETKAGVLQQSSQKEIQRELFFGKAGFLLFVAGTILIVGDLVLRWRRK